MLVESLEDRRLLAVFTVTTLTDEAFSGAGATAVTEAADGNGLSLREAIGLANLNEGGADQGEIDGDSITFTGDLSGGTIDLTLGELLITDDLTIDGSAGGSRITIDGGDRSRLFYLDTSVVAGSDSTVALAELILTNGAGSGLNGGGISTIDSPITLTNVDITSSSAAVGGGLSVNGGLASITGGTISGNTGTSGGGITVLGGATLSVSGTTIENNSSSSDGGGLHATGGSNVTITGGTVSGNSAALEGGGLWNGTGTLKIDGAVIDGNTASGDAADEGGGGIFNDGGTLQLGGLLPVSMIMVTDNVADGTLGSGGGIFNDTGGTLNIVGATIRGNTAERAGGGIEDASGATGLGVILQDTVIDDNVARGTDSTAAGNGGGLHITDAGVIDIIGGSVNGNTAAEEGGGLWNSSTGTLKIDGTTVSNNTAEAGNNSGNDQGGGGVFNNGGMLDIDNATISGNTALLNSGNGGGVMTVGGTVTIVETTIAENHAARVGGGIENNAGTMTMTDVIVGGATVTAGNNAGVNGGGLHVSGNGSTDISGSEFTFNMAAEEGGGLWNGSGTMTIDSTQISNNTASGDASDQGGGGIFNNGGIVNISDGQMQGNLAGGVLGSGGGIFNNTGGTLNIVGTSITANVAERAGGGIEDASGADGFGVILQNTTIDTNVALGTDSSAPGNGGGLHVTGDGVVEVLGGFVSGNTAAEEGGGLWNSSTGTLKIDGTSIVDNSAESANNSGNDQGGGGIFNNGGNLDIDIATITGNMAILNSGNGGGVMTVGGTVTIVDSDIRGNHAERAGGGIENNAGMMTLTDVSVGGVTVDEANTAGTNGGGLHVSGNGTTNITGGEFENNTAAEEGGGLWNGSGTMTIEGTLISGNSASGDGADQGGGGIFNNGGTINVTSADISSNVANGQAGSGGGILNDGGTLTIASSIIDTNTAVRAGGGIEATTANSRDSDVTLNDVEILSNSVGDSPGNGGGVHITDAVGGNSSSFQLLGGSIEFNSAASEGGGLWNDAGGTMTIDGATIDGNTASGDAAGNGGGGIFNNGGVVTLMNEVELTNNVSNGVLGSGGGILNLGILNFDESGILISSNQAQRAGGGIEHASTNTLLLNNVIIDSNIALGSDPTAPGNGGGFHVTGDADVMISNGSINNNTAATAGGGLWKDGGLMTIDGTTIDGNTANGDSSDDGGGGIFNNDGRLEIGNSSPTEITNNVAEGDNGSGGGILNNAGGTVSVRNSTISDNVATRAGGGIEDNSGAGLGVVLIDVDLSFNSASGAGDGPGNGGGLHVTGPGDVSISGGTIFDNDAAFAGGGLWNGSGTMTVTGAALEGNIASGTSTGGGGIFNSGGVVHLDTVRIQRNDADGQNGSGGGIFNSGAGSLLVVDSTISSNTADSSGGGIHDSGSELSVINSTLDENFAPSGGGIFRNAATVGEVINSTISGNLASDSGGGIANDAGSLSVISSTIVANRADSDGNANGIGGGIWTRDDTSASTHIFNTIVAGNSIGATGSDTPSDIDGKSIADGSANNLVADPATAGGLTEGAGGNLVGDGTGNLLSVGQVVAPLHDNFGPTQTHALVPNSRALDAGDNLLTTTAGDDGVPGTGDANETPVLGDQRGVPFSRIDGIQVDIGAYESQAFDTNSLIVNSSLDALDFNQNEITLREAILAASINPGADIIRFDPSVTSSDLTMGELVIDDFDVLTILGNGANQTTITGDGSSRLFNLLGDGDVIFDGVTLTGGHTSGNGGAIQATSDDGSITIRRSTISGNSSSSIGTEPTGNNNYGGGGIFAGSRTLVIIDSTISGNSAAADGGGINSPGEGAVTLINSTVSGNTSAGRGGGLYFDDGETLIINSTITNNAASRAGGGIGNLNDDAGETLTIHNSLIAGNTDDGTGPDLIAPGAAEINLEVLSSLIGDKTGTTLDESLTPDPTTGNIVGDPSNASQIDPMLGPLQDNGGPTATHALLDGSPAIDHADNTLLPEDFNDLDGDDDTDEPIPFDQRGLGFTRVFNATADMGAFELQPDLPNQQPSFTATNPPAVDQDSGAQSIANFATFDPGHPGETDQIVLGYTVSGVTNPGLFETGPSIDTSGVLTYTPAAGVFGTSEFTVTVQDDGGTDNGGIDTSAPQTFTITVNQFATVFPLDVTGSGTPNPFQDGIIIVRYMLGQPAQNLEDPSLIPDDATRTTGQEFITFLDSVRDSLDINGDGNVNPFQDGILIVRFLLGQPAENLEDPALIPSGSTRTTGQEIRDYLLTLMPPTQSTLSGRSGEGELVSAASVGSSDINGDGMVTMTDALGVINHLSRGASNDDANDLRYDVNGDGDVSTSDALQVINRLAGDVTAAHALTSSDDENDVTVDELLGDDEFMSGLF